MITQSELLVITSCTKRKAAKPDGALQLRDFQDPNRLLHRSEQLSRWQMPAVDMYTGQQHVFLRRGLERLRQPGSPIMTHLRIISAGYGLLDEHDLIVPYEVTFNDMSTAERRHWSQHLKIAQHVRSALAEAQIVAFLLGARYLDAILPLQPLPGQRFLFFASEHEERRLAEPGVTVVPAGSRQVSFFGAGLTSLKGCMFELLAQCLVGGGETYWAELLRGRSGHAVLCDLKEGQQSE
jgi:hypothetical protein